MFSAVTFIILTVCNGICYAFTIDPQYVTIIGERTEFCTTNTEVTIRDVPVCVEETIEQIKKQMGDK